MLMSISHTCAPSSSPATALHHSSMLQDITKGRLTEIRFINGAVVEKGRKHGIPTPYNTCIVDLIRLRRITC